MPTFDGRDKVISDHLFIRRVREAHLSLKNVGEKVLT